MKPLRRICLVCGLLLSLVVFSGSALASGGGGGVGNCVENGVTVCSVSVGTWGKLLARTTVEIDATARCAVPTGFTFLNGFGDVGISQASGRQVTQAYGNFTLSACDGATHPFVVDVTPGNGSSPFHGGQATATGALVVNFQDASGNFVQEQVFVGPQVIHIQG